MYFLPYMHAYIHTCIYLKEYVLTSSHPIGTNSLFKAKVNNITPRNYLRVHRVPLSYETLDGTYNSPAIALLFHRLRRINSNKPLFDMQIFHLFGATRVFSRGIEQVELSAEVQMVEFPLLLYYHHHHFVLQVRSRTRSTGEKWLKCWYL